MNPFDLLGGEMPSDIPGWMLALALAAMVAWSIPRVLNACRAALKWVGRLFAEAAKAAVAESLEPRLAPSWLKDFDEALEPIYQEISMIRFELTSNGGESLKDKMATTASHVHEIQQAIEPLLAEHRERWDPPSGTPTEG